MTAFVGSSGEKIAHSDMFAPVRQMAEDHEVLGLITNEEQLHQMAETIPSNTTVIIYDDASYSGAHLSYPIRDLRKLGVSGLKIAVAVVAISSRAYRNLQTYGADQVWAAYRIPSPSEVFSEAEKAFLQKYYEQYNVDEHWNDGIYGAMSHKVPDNFFKIFNFAAETYRDSENTLHTLFLLDTHGLHKSAWKNGPRRGEVGLYNE